jgi:hypothetical protein
VPLCLRGSKKTIGAQFKKINSFKGRNLNYGKTKCKRSN